MLLVFWQGIHVLGLTRDSDSSSHATVMQTGKVCSLCRRLQQCEEEDGKLQGATLMSAWRSVDLNESHRQPKQGE